MDYLGLKSRVRWLVDDQDGSYTTDSYLQECANQSYEYLQNKALLTDYSFEDTEVEIENIGAGVGNLNDYQQPGKDLEFLIVPTRFEWKLTGTAATNYNDASKVDRLEDLTPGQFIPFWKWEFGQLSFTPASLAMDIRITGEFVLSPLKEDTDIIRIARNFGHVMAYCMGHHIAIQRGNPAWEKSYGEKCDEAFDDWAIQMVKNDQVQIRRVGRMSRRVTPRPTVVTR